MSTTRPPRQPDRSEFSASEQEDYDRVVARYYTGKPGEPPPMNPSGNGHGDLGEYFGALMQSPPLCAIASRMGTFVRKAGEREGTYSHADREFVDQVLSADWKTNVVLRRHIQDALATGVRMEAIEALRYGHEEDLDEDERLLATYIRQVVSGTVDDETYAAIDARLGTRGLVEYTGFILWLQWIIRMMQALGVAAPGDEEVDQLIADLKSGSRELPDFKQWIR
jgi:hypothetical protein